MKKRILTLMLLLITATFAAEANPVDMRTTQEVAMKFVNANARTPLRGMDELQLATTYNISRGDAVFHIFNTPNGFVIVSADDCAYPILGYSDEGRQFDVNNIPIQLQDVLQEYVEQIQYAVENHLVADERTAEQWRLVQSTGRLSNNRDNTQVGPLLTTTWDQGQYYNALCPEDEGSLNGHTPTGCVATAMAQIIKYWGYPENGRGSHGFIVTDEEAQCRGITRYGEYDTLYVNFDNAVYDFDNMPNKLTNNSSQEEIDEVARLMFHCGVSVNMLYGAFESGAFDEDVRSALISNFGYTNQMGYTQKRMYADDEWTDSLKANINRGEPVYYSGRNVFSGHAFVCDGYDQDDYFHFNFGWGGDSDGWFKTSAIDVSFGFNDWQSAIMGIRPDANSNSIICQRTQDLQTVENFMVEEPTDLYHLRGGNNYLVSNELAGAKITLNLVPGVSSEQLVLDIIDFDIDQSVVIYDGVNKDSLIRVIETRGYGTWYYETRNWTYDNLPTDTVFQNMAGADFSPIVSTHHGFTIVAYGDGGQPEGYHLRVSNAADCRMVSNLAALKNEQGTLISWTENGDATQWQVKVGETVCDCDSPQILLTELNPNINYEVQVRAVCGESDYSTWNSINVNERIYWTDVVTTEPEGYSVDGDTIRISTPEGMAWLSKQRNNNSINYYMYLSIESDIDLDSLLWIPIKSWCGNIDGHGHVISNMRIVDNRYSGLYGGLFSQLSYIEINDLGLRNCSVNHMSGAGTLSGQIQSCKVTNCFSEYYQIYSDAISGGLFYVAHDSEIINCYAYGHSYTTNGYGGLVGYSANSSFDNCVTQLGEEFSWSNIVMGSSWRGLIAEQVNGGAFSNCFSDISMAKRSWDPEDAAWAKQAYFLGDLQNVGALDNLATFNIAVDPTGTLIADTAVNYTLGENMDVVTALNNKVAEYNLPNLRTWVMDSETHLPVFGDYYEPIVIPYWTEVVTEQPEGYSVDDDGNIIISSAEGLAWFSKLMESNYEYMKYNVFLVADINLGQYKWKPINCFSGVFDGQGHRIDSMFAVEREYEATALFRVIHSATIKNIYLTNCCSRQLQYQHAAGLVASIYTLPDEFYNDTIMNCYVSGRIEGHGVDVAPIVSFLGNGVIINCASNCVVIGGEPRGMLGGIAGDGLNGGCGIIRNCYSASKILSTSAWQGYVIGYSEYDLVENCYGYIERNGYLPIVQGAMSTWRDNTWFDDTDNGYALLDTLFFEPDNQSYNNLKEALNAGVRKYNIHGLRLWVDDVDGINEGMPILGPEYTVTCPNIQNLTVKNVLGANSEYGVKLLWIESGEALEWEIKYHALGDTEEVRLLVSTNPSTIFGLTEQTTYCFSVRPICGSTDIGGWSEEVSIVIDRPYWTDVITSQPEGYSVDNSGNVTIASAEGLAWLASVANGLNGEIAESFEDKSIVLTQDIDIGQYKWTAINGFLGVFNAREHVINGLYVNELSDNQGLFGRVLGGNYLNVVLENADVRGRSCVGMLIGYAGNITVINSHVSGSVYGEREVGGLLGRNEYGELVDACSSSGTVEVVYDEAGGLIGIAGRANGEQTKYNIRNSFSRCDVIAGRYDAGGLVGACNADIDNCYATGNVNGYLYNGGLTGSFGQLNLFSALNNSYYGGNVSRTDYYDVNGCLMGYLFGTITATTYGNPEISNCYSLFDSITPYQLIGPSSDVDENCNVLGSPIVSNSVPFATENDSNTLLENITIGQTSYNDLLDALNAWVDTNNTNGEYLHWVADTAMVNSGFPILEEAPLAYLITATANPTEGGTVTGAGTYNHGETVTLTATANEGYTFINWTQGGEEVSTEATYSFEVTEALVFVANFELNTYSITATANPEAGGEVTGAGTYNHGETATLTATANEGYTFINWTQNGEEVSIEASYSYEVTEDLAFVANFELNTYEITATANPEAGGEVTGAGTYNHGEAVILTATANEGYTFINWTQNGEEVSTESIYSFTVTETADYVANFELNSYEITAAANPTEGGEVTGVGTFSHGETATLTATANEGYAFINWTKDGAVVSTNASYSFTVTEAGDYVAHFELTAITQVSGFVQGWNWWSSYVELDGASSLQSLQNGLGTSGMMIKSQNDGYASYLAGFGWYGSLTTINNENTYQIRANEPCSVEMTGAMANPVEHPITLNTGWTWVGYPVAVSMGVEDALAGISPLSGDMLKSQNNGYASYLDGFGWYGSLNTLEPGMGLMFKSNNSSNITLTYPNNGTRTDLKANQTADNNHWRPNLNAYPDNMSVMAVVELDGNELQGENYELAAFANGEVRGSARLLYVKPLNRYMAFLTVAGDEPAELHFGLYNTETGEVEAQCITSIQYETNAVVGSFAEPYVVSFRGTTGVDEWANSLNVYPNPVQRGQNVSLGFNDVETSEMRVEIINAIGAVVETMQASSVQTITAPETAGVYTLRITVEGKGTCYRKLVVR